MVYVKSGSMLATVFDKKMNFVEEIILKEGDMALMLFGGHGYKIS